MFFRWGWGRATSMYFLKGRLHFHFVDGSRAKFNSGAPSVLIAYGPEDSERLRTSLLPGQFVLLR